MAARVTKGGRRDKRFKVQAKGFAEQVRTQGGAETVRQDLGEMPLTLWLLVSGVVVALYLSRAARAPAKAATKKQPTVTLPTGGPPVLPPVGGFLSPGGT